VRALAGGTDGATPEHEVSRAIAFRTS
jgi:hypothetical protein